MLCYGIPYDVYKHLMAIQSKVVGDLKYETVNSITSLFTDLKKGYANDVEELRKNNNSMGPKL